MVVMTERPKWSEERLDELARRMDAGFAELRTEMQSGFARMDVRLEAIDERSAALQRTLILVGAGLIGTLIAALISAIAAAILLA